MPGLFATFAKFKLRAKKAAGAKRGAGEVANVVYETIHENWDDLQNQLMGLEETEKE